MTDYAKLAAKVYQWNKIVGWWDDPDRCYLQTCQLISTEVSEATEAERKSLMDDKLEHRHGGEVELADAMIRALDIGGKCGLEILEWISPHRWCTEKHASIGKQHMGITASVVRLAEALEMAGGWSKTEVLDKAYTQLVKSIEAVAERNSYDLYGAVDEKFEYNKTRIDHTREHREQNENGKSF